MSVETANDTALGRWLAEANELLDFFEFGIGRIRRLGSPPPSDDSGQRAEMLTTLWKRCRFTCIEPGKPAPWEAKQSFLEGQAKMLPGELLQNLYVALGPDLDATLKVVGADPSRRLLSTEGMTIVLVEFPRGEKQPATAWAVTDLTLLPSGHLLQQLIVEGWRTGERHNPHAILGPAQLRLVGGGPPLWTSPAFVDLGDVVRWTAELRNPQRDEEGIRADREKANRESRERQFAQSDVGRLVALESELAALKRKQPA
jgi:hypothetical protein